MKSAFMKVRLLMLVITLWSSSVAWAQTIQRPAVQNQPNKSQATQSPLPLKKSNFTSFTRKYSNPGKWWVAKNKAFLRHPDANFADRNSPDSNAVEIFGKRTIDSKFFVNKKDSSIQYTQWSSGGMHVKRGGQWITVDHRLSPKGSLIYEASNQEVPVGFDIKRKSSYMTTVDGKTYFNHWNLYGKNGNKETLLATASWINYTIGDDGIAIKNIFPGIDAEMKVSKGSVKTSFIVHANKYAAYQTLLFKDAFVNGHPGNFTFSKRLAGNGLTASVDFRVGAGTTFHVSEGIMYAKENTSYFQNIPYFLDQNKLTLAVSNDFLNAQIKNGDVIIDPMVQEVGGLKKNKLNKEPDRPCTNENGCPYDFTVPAPPGALLTDVLFSFEFTAGLFCAGTDGAFSFTINNNCLSQKWVGTGTGFGPQTFPTQSMLLSNGGSPVSCLPAAICGKQDIPFTFNFFRDCSGIFGCDGSCIQASEDLVVTIVGRTFDSASLSASALGGCAGTPITLSANGFYGIAPYNYTWQGLPQFNGDSVIQVTPNSNTVYTVQVSDACAGAGPGPGPGPGNPPITKSVNINVTKPATPVFTSNSPVCAGGQLILSAPAAPGITYFIKNPNAGLGGGPYTTTAVFDNVTAAYAGNWIAVASDANGCTSDTANTNVVIIPVYVPTATITSSATNICTGTPVTFNATAINAGSSPSYQWLLNGKKVGTNSPVYSGSSFVNNDAISCVVSAGGPCAGGFDVSNVITLTVSASGSPTFDPMGPLCQNSIPPPLPLTSKEGIVGTWNPAVINTSTFGTKTYIFTPSSTGNCSSPASLNITIAGSITPTFPSVANAYCQYATAPALPSTSNEGITGTWNPAVISTSDPGSTLYTFTPTAGQCGTSLQISVLVNALPVLNMGPDQTITPGAGAQLNVSVTGNIFSYNWTPTAGLNNPGIEDPVASPAVTTEYTLRVTDDNQCEASDSIRIVVAGTSAKIIVPNAFSPNGDGINDTWVITSLSDYPGATIEVFNRIGQQVFHSENYSKPWDGNYNGKALPMATYYYIIDLKNNEKKIAGSVTLFK